LKNFLSIPIFSDDIISAVIGVANKLTDYTDNDVKQLQLLGNSAWNIINKHNAQIELHEYKNHLEELVKLRTQELQTVQKEKIVALIKGEENERGRLSQELHDGLGPLMSTLKLFMQGIQRIENPDKIKEIAQKAHSVFDEILLTITEVSNNLSPHILRKFGLFTGLKTFIEKNIKHTGIRFVFDFNHKQFEEVICNKTLQKCKFSGHIDEIYEITIYRIITELINNSVKHGNATKIELNINKIDHHIIINYADNGAGFDFDNVSKKITGQGLQNMQNRIKNINGSITFTTELNKGVAVEIIIPCDCK